MAIVMRTDSSTRPATHQMSRYQRILITVFIVSFALDFKGSVGGSMLQYFMAGLNITAFFLLATTYRFVVPKRGLGAFVYWSWIAFLLTGTLGTFANDTPFERYIRIIYPFMLFLQGFLVAWWVARRPNEASMMVSVMMVTTIVSLLFTAWWGFYFTGESLDQIRYQILSPLIPLALITAGCDLVFLRQGRLRPIVLLSVAMGLIVISVTRGPLLIILLVVAVTLLAAFWNALRTGRLSRAVMKAAVIGAIAFGGSLTVIIFLSPEAVVRWMTRTGGKVGLITFWTRVAAVVGQFEALTASPFGWLTGQGFGSSYPWPFSEFPWISPFLGPDVTGASAWFPGEFMWMPFLFYGGFIIGAIAAMVLLRGALYAFQVLIILLRGQLWRRPQLRPLWIGVLGYFAFLGMGFTANPFILRLSAEFMGLCLGLVVAQGRYALSGFSATEKFRQLL